MTSASEAASCVVVALMTVCASVFPALLLDGHTPLVPLRPTALMEASAALLEISTESRRLAPATTFSQPRAEARLDHANRAVAPRAGMQPHGSRNTRRQTALAPRRPARPTAQSLRWLIGRISRPLRAGPNGAQRSRRPKNRPDFRNSL